MSYTLQSNEQLVVYGDCVSSIPEHLKQYLINSPAFRVFVNNIDQRSEVQNIQLIHETTKQEILDRHVKPLILETDTILWVNIHEYIENNKINIVPTQPFPLPGEKTLGVFVTLYYPDLVEEIIDNLNRIPFECTIYISTPDDHCFYMVRENLINQHIVRTPFVNYGMDIGNFINQIKYLQDNKIEHDTYLKIHTKRHEAWRRGMFESLMPVATSEYYKIINLLDKQHVIFPGKYAYPLQYSRANEKLNIERLINCGYDYKKVYPVITQLASDFSPASYVRYNYDLKNLWRKDMNTSNADKVYMSAMNHFLRCKQQEISRIHTPIKEIKTKFCFSAGTMFWFDNYYLSKFIEKTEPIDQLIGKLSNECGVLKNTIDTVTHSLEYWFGIVSGMINTRTLKHLRRINFMIPPVSADSIISGGFRTLFRHIKYLQQNNFIVSLQVCGHNYLPTQREYISKFNLIENISDIPIYTEHETCYADVHVATGWQTFDRCNLYENQNQHTCFFCQDLEYNFEIVSCLDTDHQHRIYEFYTQSRPTYTMSKFLEYKLSELNTSITQSTRLTVNRKDYFNNNNSGRDGICMLYSCSKSHRLPDITLKLAKQIAREYPDMPVYLFGEPAPEKEIERYENIYNLGNLSIKELNDLYNKCKVGTCFSTTNPSRIGFEMISSGCVCIEIDCEYTKHDLDDTFILCEPEASDIYQKITSILDDKTKYKQQYKQISKYKHQQKKDVDIFANFIIDNFYN